MRPPLLIGLLLAALFGVAGLGACGEPRGPAIDDADPTIAGPALFAEVRRACLEADAKAFWALVTDAMRDGARKGAAEQKQRLAGKLEAAKEAQTALGLEHSPLDTDDETFAIAMLRQKLREGSPAEVDAEVGQSFVDARLVEGRLIVRARLLPTGKHKKPGNMKEMVYQRVGGKWRLDLDATDSFEVRWVRSIPMPPTTKKSSFGSEWNGMRFTPDGKRVAVFGRPGLVLIPFEGEEKTLHIPAERTQAIAFDPAGTWVVTCYQGSEESRPAPLSPPQPGEPQPEADRGVVLWQLPSGTRSKTLARAEPSDVAVSPDGKHIATAMANYGPNPGVWVWNVASGAGHQVTPEGTNATRCAFLDDGHVVVRLESGSVAVHELTGRRTGGFESKTRGYQPAMALHPANDRVAIAVIGEGDDTDVAIVSLADGKELVRLIDKGGRNLAFSPDGAQIGTEGSIAIERFGVQAGELRRRHLIARGPFAWHPLGGFLVALGPPPRTGERPAPDAPERADVLNVFRADE